jgi:hypothetical protein
MPRNSNRQYSRFAPDRDRHRLGHEEELDRRRDRVRDHDFAVSDR